MPIGRQPDQGLRVQGLTGRVPGIGTGVYHHHQKGTFYHQSPNQRRRIVVSIKIEKGVSA
jgi:hypothetical protein